MMVKVVSVSMSDLCATVGSEQADGLWDHSDPLPRKPRPLTPEDYTSTYVNPEEFGHVSEDVDF